MHEATLQRIQAWANERHLLYRQAGKMRLLPDEQARLRYLNDQLPALWDQYRRELAIAQYQRAPQYRHDRAA